MQHAKLEISTYFFFTKKIIFSLCVFFNANGYLRFLKSYKFGHVGKRDFYYYDLC